MIPTQTAEQSQNAMQASGLNPIQQSGVKAGIGFAAPSTPPSPTMDASAIQQNNTNPGIQFPQNQPNSTTTATNAMTTNASVPNTIPTPESITGEESKQTPAEQTNQGLLGRLAGLIGNKQSLATLQTGQESTAGVPGLTKTVNDLNTQLQGLNDQATALANAAQPGGAIENQGQLNATGRGITAGGQAPLTAAEMRKNQIQQSAISSQALTVKSAVYAAQGNLTLAKDAADKAAQVAFDAEEQDINHINALIDQNKPQMTKEEKAQADTVKAKLDDRQNQIDQSKQDYTAGIALAAAAMKNNPNDPAAQYAAQQALKLDPKAPDYLTKVADLVGKYQQDPVATQQALANLANTRANTQKTKMDIAAMGNPAAGTGDITSPVVQGWVTAIKNGQAKLSDITAAELKTNPQLKNNVIQALGMGGNSQTDILNTSIQSLTELNNMVTNNQGFKGAVGAKGPSSLFGILGSPIPGTGAADFDAKLKQVKNDVILPNLTLLHGLGRVTDREFQALTSAVTSLGTNESEGQFKKDLATLTDSLNKKATDSGIAITQSTGTDQYSSFRSQLQAGEILVNRNGKATAIMPNELQSSDVKL